MTFDSQIAQVRDRAAAVMEQLADPNTLKNRSKAATLFAEQKELQETLALADALKKTEQQLQEAETLRQEASDAEMRAMADEELASAAQAKERLIADLTIALLPKDPYDHKNVIVEIRAGAGGDEAALFAGNLFRMYSRLAEKKGWQTGLLSANQTGIGGFKEVIFSLSGADVYRTMKYEAGVHRVQRVPETEKAGRIHTSTATVAVLPEAEDVDIQIKPEELRIDIYRSGGHGGQSVNTTDSAVRLTHLPTGIVVAMQDERSQLKNKEKAMRVLRTRLQDHFEEQAAKERGDSRRTMVGTGDRSEKIRTYNIPQDRVTDHRIKLTLHGVGAVLDGDIDAFVSALTVADQQAKLAANA